MDSEIQCKLIELAFRHSVPFCYGCYGCYGCYVEAPSARCQSCGSDDLMRLVQGVGCEWGVDWVIEHILETALEPVNLEKEFEQSVRDCYPKSTTVGWADFDTVDLLKTQDPIGWRCAVSDYESNEADEGTIVSFDNGCTYYRASDIEDLVKT
jgi:hypothetical protein